MKVETARDVATKKLISIYNSASSGSGKQKEVIAALGRVGGLEAAEKLVSIYNGASSGSAQQIAAIHALGEVGRQP